MPEAAFGLERADRGGPRARALLLHRCFDRGHYRIDPALGQGGARFERGELALQRDQLRGAADGQQLLLRRMHHLERGHRLRPVESKHDVRSLHLDGEVLAEVVHHRAPALGLVGDGHELVPDPIPESEHGGAGRFPAAEQVLFADQLVQVLVRGDHGCRALGKTDRLTVVPA